VSLSHHTLNPAAREEALRKAFARLEELRSFAGAPGQFWPSFLEVALTLAFGEEAALLTRTRAAEGGLWKEAFCWPATSQLFATLKDDRGDLERLGAEAEGDGASSRPARQLTAVRLATGEAQRSAILIVRHDPAADEAEAIARLRLLADAPLIYQLTRAIEQARQDTSRFAVVFDVAVLLNAQSRFMGAAMTLCNEVAARYRCNRVSLGWLHQGYVRLQAISHTEKFERRMGIAISIEQAMDEALDQDEEVLWPAPPASSAITRDHEAFARSQGVAEILSLPIRVDSSSVAVLTLEKATLPCFTPSELQTLRLLCDHVARRFHELKRNDRWFGARFATWAREQVARLFGPEHTVGKAIAVGVASLFAVLMFGKAEYRVEAPFILKSDVLAQLPAPFDGYLDEVSVRVGDPVREGQPLLMLDTRELLVQEAAAVAERERFIAEARKAESEEKVADMQIAQASAEEAKARLELVRHHLAKARVLSPFDGYVVQGDLRERLSAPVKQGDVLVKVAKLEAMHAEVAMPETDVHETAPQQSGEIAFASRPQLTFPIRVERIEPAAEVRDNKNIFVIRAEFACAKESWWRPGMSGVCKVNAGKRNLLWIFTHRTVDFLRLHLWW
jgi:biotin carboxyl carrier protein